MTANAEYLSTQPTHTSPAIDVPLETDSRGNLKVTMMGLDVASVDGAITYTHATLGVTTGSQAALAASASRKYALLINDSDTDIYIKIGAAAVANQGIRLNANGGSFEMSYRMGNLDTAAINAIHGGSGTKVLLIASG